MKGAGADRAAWAVSITSSATGGSASAAGHSVVLIAISGNAAPGLATGSACSSSDAAVAASSRLAEVSSCSARRASSSGAGSFRNPAANWCNRRRISSAASTNRRASSGVPWPMASERVCACSSARASCDKSLKPTVAELPASECASAIGASPIGRCSSIAHSAISVVRRRDSSSASLR